MFNVGPLELIIVLIIALIVLGPSKLPEVGRSVGKGIREFKSAVAGGLSGGSEDPIAGIEWNEHGEFPDFEEELEIEREGGSGSDARGQGARPEGEQRRSANGDGEPERREREREEFDRVQAEEEARARQELS